MKMDVYQISSSSSSSIGCLSSHSVSSNMFEEQHDDDTASSSSNSNDSMFEFSDLKSQLPIKRGLSKHYNGKSDSFKNLNCIKSLEDIPKNISQRNNMYKTKRKLKGKCGRLLDQGQNSKQEKFYYTTPKSNITKRSNKGSIKALVLMDTWSGRSCGLNSSTTNRFIHV